MFVLNNFFKLKIEKKKDAIISIKNLSHDVKKQGEGEATKLIFKTCTRFPFKKLMENTPNAYDAAVCAFHEFIHILY